MFKNIIKVLLSNVILAIVGIINSFIFPIVLSKNDYAYFQQFSLYLSYVNICHLGMASGMFLNYAGQSYKAIDKKRYKSEINLLLIILLIFTFTGLIFSGIQDNRLYFLTAISIMPQCLIASFQALYQAWERFSAYSIINAAPRVILTAIIFLGFLKTWNITGENVVLIFIVLLWIFALYFVIEFITTTRNVKSAPIFSKVNLITLYNGFLITLGNYINLLFHSIDKQFVLTLYSTESFALYSFAMSMQNIMIIFISAMANPFYPRLAKGDMDKNYISRLKELLIMFGAFSGCAYFAVSFIVKHFIRNYIDSLTIIKMFFAVFPAMAIIDVLYVNLYKIKRLLKKYIFTLIAMLCLAVALNFIAVFLKSDYIGISFATMLCYYIWLFYSQRDFEEIKICKKDIIYLLGFFIIYYLMNLVDNDIVGFFTYGLVIVLWDWLIYKKSIKFAFNRVTNRG